MHKLRHDVEIGLKEGASHQHSTERGEPSNSKQPQRSVKRRQALIPLLPRPMTKSDITSIVMPEGQENGGLRLRTLTL